MTIIYMTNVPEKGDAWRGLFKPLPCKMWPGYQGREEVPDKFIWNGNSAGPLVPLYPRHNHPIASARHDFRCEKAENAEQRKWSDVEYEKDVSTTGWWITAKLGYLGVRVGAFLGIGNRF